MQTSVQGGFSQTLIQQGSNNFPLGMQYTNRAGSPGTYKPMKM